MSTGVVDPGTVVIDARLIHRPVSGLVRYVENLALHVSRIEGGQPLAIAVEWPPRVDPGLARQCVVVPIFDERHLVQTVSRSAVSVYHLTWLGYSPAHYLPLAVAPIGVLTVPDFVLWDHPDYIPSDLHHHLQAALKACVPWADRVLVYSEHTRSQAQERLGIPDEQISVVPLGVDPRFVAEVDDAALEWVRRRIGRPYLLTVGKDYPHKNLRRLVEAFAQSGLRDHALVVAGESVWPGARADLMSLARKDRIADRLVFLDHVGDEDLPALYRASDAFVFPSLEEGFGLAPLEAMAAGTPVVCSNAASLPEVVGDAAVLVDSRSAEALAHAIRSVVDDPTLRGDLIERGKARASQFTWERTASLTAATYRRASESAGGASRTVRPQPFVLSFPEQIPLIARTLAGRRKRPHATTLVWIPAEAFRTTLDEPLARLRRLALTEWLRERLSLADSTAVLLEDEGSSTTAVGVAVSLAEPSRLILIGSDRRELGIDRGAVPRIDQWPQDDVLSRLRTSGLLPSEGAQRTENDLLAPFVCPESVARTFGDPGRVIGAFPVQPGVPLAAPDRWVGVLSSLAQSDGAHWVLVGDERAIKDAEWVRAFRAACRHHGVPWQAIWLASGMAPEVALATIGKPNPDEWLVVGLDNLSDEGVRALARRPARPRVAVTVRVAALQEHECDLAALVGRAWSVHPDAAFVDAPALDTQDPMTRAAVEEIRASVGSGGDSTLPGRILQLRQEVQEYQRRERELCEQAMRSHVEGVKSLQEQIEQLTRRCEALSQVIARLCQD